MNYFSVWSKGRIGIKRIVSGKTNLVEGLLEFMI